MSTVFHPAPRPSKIGSSDALSRRISGLLMETSLLQPEYLAARLSILDELDALGGLDLEVFATASDPWILYRAKKLRSLFEAANEALYACARAEIVHQGNSATLRRWLMELARDQDTHGPRPGLGFDLRDEIVSGVLRLCEPEEAGYPPSPEMVPYQPTPARHILDLIDAGELSGDDMLVDLGSGLGHVPLLVSVLAGIRTLGVEFEPAYVASAREAARNLNLNRVRFVAEDARLADLSSGTVFYLFSPFKGSILTEVLRRLNQESRKRPIRICSLGPCTRVLQEQAWLKACRQSRAERIAVFQSQEACPV